MTEAGQERSVIAREAFARRFVITLGFLLPALYAETYDPIEVAFYEADPALSYPFQPTETISTTQLIGIAIIVPIFLLLGISYTFGNQMLNGQKRSLLYLFIAHFVLVTESFAITFFITNVMKTLTGRHRPNFYAYCGIDTDRMIPGRKGSFKNCTAPSSHIQDSHRSFPSGHSSIAFSGYGLVAGFALDCCVKSNGLYRKRALVIAGLALTCASMIALTRALDNYHHVTDIVAGAVLGLFTARYFLRLTYPHGVHDLALNAKPN